MPVIELDMLIAFVNKADKLHSVASKIFDKIANGTIRNAAIPTSAYMEYELVLKSRGLSDEEIAEDLEAFKQIRNLDEIPLTAAIIIEASKIRTRYGLTYFDSLHAASALHHDKIIISVDTAYDKVKELRRVDPKEVIG